MKKFIIGSIATILIAISLYFTVVYYWSYSEGYRSGQLVKLTYKGILFKTYEGEVSQGVSEAQRFHFSVEDKEVGVIELLQLYQGKNVRLKYKERFATFPWWGDTRYFIIDVEKVETLEN